VRDVNSGTTPAGYPYPSRIQEMTAVDGSLFFSANDGAHGQELWTSDGTAAGTTLVHDIHTSITGTGDSPGAYPGELRAVGSTLFFTAYDFTRGHRLWRSDGTTVGTDPLPGGNRTALARDFVVAGEDLYFTDVDDEDFRQVWRAEVTTTDRV